MNKIKKEVDMLMYHDPGDENDSKDISKDAEMIPKDLAEKINERNKLFQNFCFYFAMKALFRFKDIVLVVMNPSSLMFS